MNHFRFRSIRNGIRIEWMEADVSVERERSMSSEKQRCYLWALKRIATSYRVNNLRVNENDRRSLLRSMQFSYHVTFSARGPTQRSKEYGLVTTRLRRKLSRNTRDYFVTVVKEEEEKKNRKGGF